MSDDDGRWKKQAVDPRTGAVNEMDVLDTGTGKIDRGTGNIYLPTSEGPQVIGVDPQQKQLAQIVDQKAQAQAQGSPIAANITAAKAALFATQQQLQAFQGIPERMSAQIGKYTQASLDSNNTAAAGQLQNAQTAFSDWKQQNPSYTALAAKRDALGNQIQTQIAAKAQNEAQVAQLLTTPQYAQWNGNTPLSSNATGQNAAFPNGSNGSNGSVPASDISLQDLDTRAGVIAAQTGYPAGLAYASALREAKQQGSQTVDGSAIGDAIQGVQPALQTQLPKMAPPQLRQAFQSGLITRQQAQTAATAQPVAQDQSTAAADNSGQNADPVAQSVADLTARAASLRTKIQSAFGSGGADGVKNLATYRAALADTESQLHAATQTLVNRVPAAMQERIANGVAPGLDWNAVAQQNARDPMAYFATENLGSALLDQVFPFDRQLGMRTFVSANGVNPALSDLVANQAIGADAVKDLYATVLQGGNLEQKRARTLQDMGFLQQSDPYDPTSPLHLTEDAQRLLPPGAQSFVQVRPDVARYNRSPDPAHGSALYQNAVAGMEHFSNTAQKMLPAPLSAPEPNAAPAPRQPIIPGLPHPLDLPDPSSPPTSIIPGLDDALAAPTSANAQSSDATSANGNANPAPSPRQPIIPGLPHPLDLPDPSSPPASAIPRLDDAAGGAGRQAELGGVASPDEGQNVPSGNGVATATQPAPASAANPVAQAAGRPNAATGAGDGTAAGGAWSADSGQAVAAGGNPAKAAPADAGTPPQAQAPGGASDGGKANAPGSGAPQHSNGQASGAALDANENSNAAAADHSTETSLPNAAGGAINPQSNPRQNPSAKFDSEGQRLQTPDETETLNRMKSIQQNIMQSAESFYEQARELENNGDWDGAKAADDNAKSEKEKANRLTDSIIQIEGMIKNTHVGEPDSANLRVLDAAFHLWVGRLPDGSPLAETYNLAGEGGERTHGRFKGADKCNVAVFDTLTQSGVVKPGELTQEDTGNPKFANYYNRIAEEFSPKGLGAMSDPQWWDGSKYVGDERPGDVVSWGMPRTEYAHVAISLGNGWHIGASQSDPSEAYGQKKGININADEYENNERGYPSRIVRSPLPSP